MSKNRLLRAYVVFLDILAQVLFLFLIYSLCPGGGGRLTGISVFTEIVSSCSLITCFSIRVVILRVLFLLLSFNPSTRNEGELPKAAAGAHVCHITSETTRSKRIPFKEQL